MTPEMNIEKARRVPTVQARQATSGTHQVEPPTQVQHAPSLLLILVAVVAALTAFFAGLKDLSAAMPPPPRQVQSERPPTEDELEAAQGMEAIMANMLIEQMRKSVPDSEFMPKSQGERIFESMLDYEYAQTLSRAGSLGFSELILAEMRRNR